MSGQLAGAVRTVIATLRSLANTLESALARAEVASSVPPALDLESAHSWEVPTPIVSEPAPVQFLSPRHGSTTALTASSPARTSYSTNSYHEVADSLPALPGYCLDWCIRLGAAGLVQHTTAECQNQGPLPSLPFEPRSTSSSRPLDFHGQFELEPLPSTSGCSHRSRRVDQTQDLSPTLSHHWLRQESTVPPLALIFLSNNDLIEDSREGVPHAVCPAPSSRGPASSGGGRSFCGAYYGEREWSASCDSGRVHPRRVDSAGVGGNRGLSLWAFLGDSGAIYGGGRSRTGGSLRDKLELLDDGLQLGHLSWATRVRPCDRRSRDPVFLGRISPLGAFFQCSPFPSLRMDDERRCSGQGPVLLRRRGEGETHRPSSKGKAQASTSCQRRPPRPSRRSLPLPPLPSRLPCCPSRSQRWLPS